MLLGLLSFGEGWAYLEICQNIMSYNLGNLFGHN